eukprot:gene2605-biopygen2096
MKVMEFRYAPSTWVQRRSILKSYLHFCHDNHLAVTHDSMTQFIIWKKSKVSNRSAVQYMKTLISLMTGCEPRYLTVLRGLQRLSASDPIHQAVGITPTDMIRLIALAPDWQTRIVLRLAWMTASRWAEVSALTTKCFTSLDGKVLILDWGTLPKTSKEKPYRSFQFVMFSERFSNRLRQLMRSRGEGSLLTNMTGTHLRSLMARLGPRINSLGTLSYTPLTASSAALCRRPPFFAQNTSSTPERWFS